MPKSVLEIDIHNKSTVNRNESEIHHFESK